MKILVKDTLRNKETLYLQKCDVRHLLEHPDIIRSPKIKPGSPKAIELDKIESHGYESFRNETTNIESNRLNLESSLTSEYDFCMAYEDPASIGWINSHKWIYDYDEYIVVPIDELDRNIREIHHTVMRKFTELTEADCDHMDHMDRIKSAKSSNGKTIDSELEATLAREDALYQEYHKYEVAQNVILIQKEVALSELVQYLRGKINFIFPSEYQGLVRHISSTPGPAPQKPKNDIIPGPMTYDSENSISSAPPTYDSENNIPSEPMTYDSENGISPIPMTYESENSISSEPMTYESET